MLESAAAILCCATFATLYLGYLEYKFQKFLKEEIKRRHED